MLSYQSLILIHIFNFMLRFSLLKTLHFFNLLIYVPLLLLVISILLSRKHPRNLVTKEISPVSSHVVRYYDRFV